MTATAQMTAPEFISAVAALCGPGEAAFTMITASEGLSYCIASEQTAHRTAHFTITAAERDPDVLGVAVITAGGTLTEYPVANA